MREINKYNKGADVKATSSNPSPSKGLIKAMRDFTIQYEALPSEKWLDTLRAKYLYLKRRKG